MENIFAILVGIVIMVLGLITQRGNVSLLHSYHVKRVSEEDKIPFARLVGLGLTIVGIGIVAMGVMSILAASTQNALYSTIGTVVMVVGLVGGLGIAFYAMFKYNKGIF